MVKKHWIAIILIVLGTFLRVYQLNESAIFFGDSARDVLVAIESVEEKTLPLLGIPSSTPEFKQGPISIWITMFLYSLFGTNLFVFSVGFVLIGIASMIAIYEFCLVYLDKKTGQISLALLAFSPLAIAHSRMVYHTTPIPLFLILSLSAMIGLWKKKKTGAFWASLSLAFLFQFELSLAPFFLMIPYIIWRTRQKINFKIIFQIFSGFVLGLLPQIIFDLTHNFQQIGGFIKWIIHQMLLFVLPEKSGFSLNKVSLFLEKYWLYFGRIWGTDNTVISILMFIILFIAIFRIFKLLKSNFKNTKSFFVQEIILMSAVFLTLGYFVSSSLSEAYFPPYFVLLPLIISLGITLFNKNIQQGFFILLILIGILNVIGVFKHNFFVSNNQLFSYGPSIKEQRSIVSYILLESQGNFFLKTQNKNGKFPSFFDGYRYLSRENGVREDINGQVFYIEKINSYPTIIIKNSRKITKTSFESISVYHNEK